MTRLLRLAAWTIAIGAAIDPAMALSRASRPRLAIVTPPPSSAAAGAVRDRLARDLSPSYDIVPHLVTDAAAAIVIGERYPDEPVPDTMPSSGLGSGACAAWAAASGVPRNCLRCMVWPVGGKPSVIQFAAVGDGHRV